MRLDQCRSHRVRRCLLRLDYVWTVVDARTMAASPLKWLRGTSVLVLEAIELFARSSDQISAICGLSSNGVGQGRRLVIHLSASTPLALY